MELHSLLWGPSTRYRTNFPYGCHGEDFDKLPDKEGSRNLKMPPEDMHAKNNGGKHRALCRGPYLKEKPSKGSSPRIWDERSYVKGFQLPVWAQGGSLTWCMGVKNASRATSSAPIVPYIPSPKAITTPYII